METSTRPAGRLRQAGIVVGCFVALLWVLEILDTVSGHRLDAYGVRPRTDEGLVGVVVAPTLHFGFDHLISNTLPVLVLGVLVLASGVARGLAATAVIWVVAGMGVWLVGDSFSNHAGASALVFGWIVYLGVRGFLNRSWGQVAVGVLVLLVYGSVLWGVLPGQPGVSWEGHLFGAIGGALAARLVVVRRRAAVPVALSSTGSEGAVGVVRGRLVPLATPRTAQLLHLGLEDVAPSLDQGVEGMLLDALRARRRSRRRTPRPSGRTTSPAAGCGRGPRRPARRRRRA